MTDPRQPPVKARRLKAPQVCRPATRPRRPPVKASAHAMRGHPDMGREVHGPRNVARMSSKSMVDGFSPVGVGRWIPAFFFLNFVKARPTVHSNPARGRHALVDAVGAAELHVADEGGPHALQLLDCLRIAAARRATHCVASLIAATTLPLSRKQLSIQSQPPCLWRSVREVAKPTGHMLCSRVLSEYAGRCELRMVHGQQGGGHFAVGQRSGPSLHATAGGIRNVSEAWQNSDMYPSRCDKIGFAEPAWGRYSLVCLELLRLACYLGLLDPFRLDSMVSRGGRTSSCRTLRRPLA